MRLSVVIPALRRDAFLAECLASVGEAPDVETIVIEGVAPVGEARNQALARATGDWILFVDADDVLAPGWLDAVKGLISRHPNADLVGFALSKTLPLAPCELGATRVVDVRHELPTDVFGRLLCQYAVRRELIAGMRFSGLARGEDRLFEGEALLRAQKVALSDALVYGYRQHDGSAMHQPWDERNLGDEINWRVRWLELLARSGKSMDRRGWREMGLCFLEYIPYAMRAMTSAREKVESRWFVALGAVAELGFAGWQRAVMRLLAKTRSPLLVKLLCQLPFEVKRRTLFLRRIGA